MTTLTIPSATDELIAEIELDFQSARKLGREAYIDMQDGEALIARIRELEQYKREAMQVMNPVLDYARPLNLAKWGESITQALIADHQRLVALEQAQRWVPVTERMPEVGVQVLACKVGRKTSHSPFFAMACKNEMMPWRYIDGDRCDVKVSHWQPLPELPK